MTELETAVVTGSTGFIGSALVRRLATEGAEVICLLRADSTPERLQDVSGVRLARLDALADLEVPDRAVVFNLGSYGVRPDQRDAEPLVEGNITSLVRLVTAAQRWRARRLIHIGSCAEYAPMDSPQLIDESHPLGHASVYGASKAAAHLVGTAWARRLAVDLVTLRLFGTYGPGEAAHRLIPHVATCLARGERVPLTSGEQVRDLTYIDDVVDACLTAARSDHLAQHSAYNVCSGVPVRIRDVAEKLARAMGQPLERLAFGEAGLRDYETAWLVGDPQRFQAATGWKPQVDLDQGIRRSVDAVLST